MVWIPFPRLCPGILSIGFRQGMSLWDINFRGERIIYELAPQEALAVYCKWRIYSSLYSYDAQQSSLKLEAIPIRAALSSLIGALAWYVFVGELRTILLTK